MNLSVKNSRIKILLMAGLTGALFSVLFPPHVMVWTRAGTGTVIRETPIGFHLLFDPPTFGDRTPAQVHSFTEVNFVQLGLQIAAVACVVGVACLFASSSSKEAGHKPKGQSEKTIQGGSLTQPVEMEKGKAAEETVNSQPGETLSPYNVSSPPPSQVEMPDSKTITATEGVKIGEELSQPDAIDVTASRLAGGTAKAAARENETNFSPSVLYSISILATILFVVWRFSDHGIATIVGGCLGSALVGGVSSGVIWVLRQKMRFGPAAIAGFGFIMPIWAAVSLLVHLSVTPSIQERIGQDSAAANWERLQTQVVRRSELRQNRTELGDIPSPKSLDPLPLTNWHVSVVTIDLPAQPKREIASDSSNFKMSSNFVATAMDRNLQVHVAFRRLHSGYPTPKEIWKERMEMWATGGVRVDAGITWPTTVTGHEALGWFGDFGTDEARALVIAAGHDYCIISVIASPEAIQADAQRILSSVEVVGFKS
jgi:hypothetical protein